MFKRKKICIGTCIEGKRWKKEELWGVEEEGNGVGKKGGRGEGRGNGSMEEG